MIKTVTVEIEVCDYCRENEVTDTCQWCGRVLCKKCRLIVHGLNGFQYRACPECRANKLNTYYKLKEEADELHGKWKSACAKVENEYRELLDKQVN